MFASSNPWRFRSHSHKTEGASLLIDGVVVTDPATVLNNWMDHFSKLGDSLFPSALSLPNFQSVYEIEASTFLENDYVLDTPSVVEEIEAALCHLKKDT